MMKQTDLPLLLLHVELSLPRRSPNLGFLCLGSVPASSTIELNARPEKCQQLFSQGGGRKFKSVADRRAGGYKRNKDIRSDRSRGQGPWEM